MRLGACAVVVGVMLSCDGDGCSECADCQSAIDHMQVEIRNNQCNPNFMQKAIERIEDNCEDHGPTSKFVGAIYEWCKTLDGQGEPQVLCETPELTNFAIDFRIDPSILAEHTNGLLFSLDIDLVAYDEVVMPAGTDFTSRNLNGLTDGRTLTVDVYGPDDDAKENILWSASGELFIRQSSGEWEAPNRLVHLTLTPEGDETLVFVNF